MGNAISWMKSIFSSPIPQNVIMIGLDAAGKTTILYLMAGNDMMATIPTIGFNVEKIQVSDTTIKVYDVGGQTKIRRLWNNYFEEATGMVFVIDFIDEDRWVEARNELWKMLEIRSVPLLVLANKADEPNNPRFQEDFQRLVNVLELSKYNAPWKVFHVSGIPTKSYPRPMDRLFPAFKWFTTTLKDRSYLKSSTS